MRGYACTCRFRHPFRILRTCPGSTRRAPVSPFLSFSFALLRGCWLIFFYFTRRAYQSPAATRRNAISIFRHRMENPVTMLRRSPFNGGIFNAIATNAPRASGLQSRASPRKWNSFEMDCKIDAGVTFCNFVLFLSFYFIVR